MLKDAGTRRHDLVMVGNLLNGAKDRQRNLKNLELVAQGFAGRLRPSRKYTRRCQRTLPRHRIWGHSTWKYHV